MTSESTHIMARKIDGTRADRYAIVVVCWNNRALLGDCLDSIRAQTIGAHRITTFLVDNASADDSVEFVKASYPEVEVIEVGFNSGFSHANNLAVKRALSDPSVSAVALLNSDARLSTNWFEVVGGFAATRPLGASFQALTLDHNNQDLIDSHHLYLTRSLNATQHLTGKPNLGNHHNQRVFGVNAAAALYTRAFIEAQPFDDLLDETMGMYLEDVDLAARALVMGWESWFVEGTFATHIGSASTKVRSGGFSLRQTWRNQPVLLLTNFSWKLLAQGFFGLLWHDIGAVRHLKATGQGELVPQLWAGRKEGIKLISYALHRRKRLRPYIQLDDETIWAMMLNGAIIN